MTGAIKHLVKSAIDWTLRSVASVRYGRSFLERVIVSVTARTQTIHHHGLALTFASPNSLNRFRIDTFSSKEPETLEWIDRMPQGSVLWDIGANIGLYSCYAAKAAGCRVYAFEPSVFNLEMLARNIFLNDLTGQIVIVPLPLSEKIAVNVFNMSTTDWGGALSTFGQPFGHDGNDLRKIFEYSTIGVSMVDAVTLLKIPQPDYIKIDVDGIEHMILKGGGAVLRDTQGVLIEINEQFETQFVESRRYLSESGFVLKERRHADMFDDTQFKNTYNQIWHRPSTH
jgi:FkbM family methyltransferase